MLYRIRKNISRYGREYLLALNELTCLFPFMLFSIPFIIRDTKSMAVLPLLIILDYFVDCLKRRYFDYRFALKLKKRGINKCFNGNQTVYESDLVNKFKNLVTKCFTFIVGSGYRIKVVLSDKLGSTATTFSSVSFGSIIVISSHFNEKEDNHIYQLAHEFGHVYHFIFGIKAAIIPIVVTIIHSSLCTYLVANSTNIGIITKLFMLYICGTCLFVLYYYLYEYLYNNEKEADLAALNIICAQLGYDKMRNAASFYLKKRINNAHKSENNNQFSLNYLDRKAMLSCISELGLFVSRTELEKLIERSESRSKDYIQDEDLNNRMKSDKLLTEKRIRMILKARASAQSFELPDFHIEDNMTTIALFYNISLIGAIVVMAILLDNYTYTWGTYPFWIAPVVAIIMYIINHYIKKAIWKKTTQLMERIGL